MTSASRIAIRQAVLDDIVGVRVLDKLCFPPGVEDVEPAAVGEIERGITDNTLLVAEREARLVGYLEYSVIDGADRPLIFVTGLGVHPEARRNGIARALLTHLLAVTGVAGGEGVCRYATTTSPGNVRMISLLSSFGFEGVDYIAGYFGPGKDRLYFERETIDRYQQRADPVLVPVDARAAVAALLSNSERRLLGVLSLPSGPHFEVSRKLPSDESTMMSNEVAVSSSFAGIVLASLTFLFGFVATGGRTSPDLLGFAAISLVLSTFALVGYTNASGELARIRSGSYSRHMVIANVVSEFGGVYPLFVLTPAISFDATGASPISFGVAAGSSLVLAIYNRSKLNLIDRYACQSRFPPVWLVYKIALACLPLLGFILIALFQLSWLWSLIAGTLLIAAMVVCLRISQEGSASS